MQEWAADTRVLHQGLFWAEGVRPLRKPHWNQKVTGPGSCESFMQTDDIKLQNTVMPLVSVGTLTYTQAVQDLGLELESH